jgi:hypothetical protein
MLAELLKYSMQYRDQVSLPCRKCQKVLKMSGGTTSGLHMQIATHNIVINQNVTTDKPLRAKQKLQIILLLIMITLWKQYKPV